MKMEIIGTNITFADVIKHNIDEQTGMDILYCNGKEFAKLEATGHLMMPLEITILDSEVHLEALNELRNISLDNTLCRIVDDLFLWDTEVAIEKENGIWVQDLDTLSYFWCDIGSLGTETNLGDKME